MKTLQKFIFAGFLLISLASCEDGEFCRDGKGPTEVKNLDLSVFSGIHVKTEANVFVRQGDVQAVRIEAQRNVLDELDVEVVNGILSVDTDDCFFDYDMDVYVTLTQPLSKLTVSGSSDILGEGTINCANATEFTISGSGSITMDIKATQLESIISGSGKLVLSGQAGVHEALISGSGDLKGFDLICKDYETRISGSGKADVYVDGGVLDAKISGSGNVRYKGNPKEIKTQISGSGSVINAN